jgi:pimeloyl-ACP methyl ester carboxylesterase
MRASPEVRAETMLVPLNGRSVEVLLCQTAGSARTILLLHEALGSVSYWKDFPEKLAEATGANVLAYSRAGQGNSEGPITMRDQAAYVHEIAIIVPALLGHFRVERPMVYGHSEGAGLAIMYAAHSQSVKALILESPFVGPAKESSEHVARLATHFEGSRMQQRLRHYHRDADAVFAAWIAGMKRFTDGPVMFGDSLKAIQCPVLALQGADDEFGTTPHRESMMAALPAIQFEVLAQTGHLPHRQSTQTVLNLVCRFLDDLPSTHWERTKFD